MFFRALRERETNIQGEMEVQAFLWANDASSPAGRILFVVGGLLLPEQRDAMRAAYLRGKAARPIAEHALPFRLKEPLVAVRAALEPIAA